MNFIDPDNNDQLQAFYREWRSCYTELNFVKPPSLSSLRVLFQYANFGSMPGEFIMSILTNDLYATYATCARSELDLIYGTVQYVLIRLPFESYGSAEKVTKWVDNMKKSKMWRPTDLY